MTGGMFFVVARGYHIPLDRIIQIEEEGSQLTVWWEGPDGPMHTTVASKDLGLKPLFSTTDRKESKLSVPKLAGTK